MEFEKRLIDLEQVSESIIWGIVNNPDNEGNISDKIIEYLYGIPVVQKYDIDGIVEKMIYASEDGLIKLDDAIEIVKG